MPSYDAILKRAQERQGRAQMRTRSMLGAALGFSPADLALGPEHVTELVGELYAAVLVFARREIEQAVARARTDMVDPVVKAGDGKVELGPEWEDKAHRLIAFHAKELRRQLDLAVHAYVGALGAQVARAETLGWSREQLVAVVAEDISNPGPMWGAFRADVRKAVEEATGHAWTSTWVAAWSELHVDPAAVLNVRRPTPGKLRVIDGGRSDG